MITSKNYKKTTENDIKHLLSIKSSHKQTNSNRKKIFYKSLSPKKNFQKTNYMKVSLKKLNIQYSPGIDVNLLKKRLIKSNRIRLGSI